MNGISGKHMKAAWMMPMPGPQIHRQSGRPLTRKALISPVSLALGGSCGLDFAFVPRGRGADVSIDGLAMPMSGICRLVCVLGPLRNNKWHVCMCAQHVSVVRNCHPSYRTLVTASHCRVLDISREGLVRHPPSGTCIAAMHVLVHTVYVHYQCLRSLMAVS